jgi:o-succinylbenzoate synthase
MGYDLAVRVYRRPFAQPLQTAHGPWAWREGLLLRLRDRQGRVGYGEVAPIPWFGSETLAAALAFCQGLGGTWDADQPVPETLPATQFGLETALGDLTHPGTDSELAIPVDSLANAAICGLLPAGSDALAVAPQRLALGHRTLKWKIGVFAVDREIHWLRQLVAALPITARLRLDANGGLSQDEAEQWLEVCDDLNAQPGVTIEHLEQPLPAAQLAAMVALEQRFTTAIALDESVATVTQLEQCWALGWRGVVVVKPAIAGSPHRLRAFCRRHRPRLVVSSTFETRVGRGAALALADQLAPSGPLTLGFGTQGWFEDDWDTLTAAALWNRL